MLHMALPGHMDNRPLTLDPGVLYDVLRDLCVIGAYGQRHVGVPPGEGLRPSLRTRIALSPRLFPLFL